MWNVANFLSYDATKRCEIWPDWFTVLPKRCEMTPNCWLLFKRYRKNVWNQARLIYSHAQKVWNDTKLWTLDRTISQKCVKSGSIDLYLGPKGVKCQQVVNFLSCNITNRCEILPMYLKPDMFSVLKIASNLQVLRWTLSFNRIFRSLSRTELCSAWKSIIRWHLAYVVRVGHLFEEFLIKAFSRGFTASFFDTFIIPFGQVKSSAQF